jgi:glycosyltransferase involved in cell wall biosynthesis
MVKISIVIPTINEEKYLPVLLNSIKRQTFKDYEVIVSDSNSKDNTVKVAKKFGAKVVLGPRKGPGAGRNLGAKHAKGEILFFIDADTELTNKNTLKVLAEKFSDKTVVGGTFVYVPVGATFFDTVMYFAANTASLIGSLINVPFTPGFCLFVRAAAFRKVGGFNEELPLCEDLELSHRIAKRVGGKSIRIPIIVANSARRFRKSGFWCTVKTYLKSLFYLYLTGNVPKEKLKFVPASEY